MVDGVVAELQELIDLRRYAQSVHYKPQGRVLSSGVHMSKLRGRGMDFAEVRNYQAGDEIRHMEWRVTARTGRPHVKIYQEERERPVVLLVDFNPSMIFGTRVAFKSVLAARLAAILAWTVSQQGDRVGGFFFSATQHSEFLPRSRESAVLPLLAALSAYTSQTELQKNNKPKQLADALIRVRRVVRPGTLLVLISDFYTMDAECEKHLSLLRAHHDVLAYHVCDTIELAPPKSEQYAITNGQQELVLDTALDAVRTGYQGYCEQRIADLKERFKRLRVQYVQITPESSLAQVVKQTVPRRHSGA